MKMLKTGIVLLLICVIAAVTLAFTNEVTKDRIQEQRFQAGEQAKKEVFSEADRFEEIEVDANEFPKIKSAFKALDASGTPVGMVVFSQPSGFGGAIEVITGFRFDGVITGLRIGTHAETPGLGAKAKDLSFYQKFEGLNALDGIVVVKSAPATNQVEAITGATITSDAVNSGVTESAALLRKLVEGGAQ
ncbi:MAG: RnfABCDGE type electron transport complex subunit G [Bacillota bacterium]|nr:RnfABCDGE type electron transport complex subunit G [Bacillota bacterium]